MQWLLLLLLMLLLLLLLWVFNNIFANLANLACNYCEKICVHLRYLQESFFDAVVAVDAIVAVGV